MTIDSLEYVIYTAYFVLPGYIIDNVIESIVPRGSKSDGEKILGGLTKYQPIRRLMARFDIMVQNPFSTAWDFKFANLVDGRRIVVALTDGSFVRGLYYNKSMASSNVNSRDIYLEQCCMIDEDSGEWYLMEHNDGVWIPEKPQGNGNVSQGK